MSLREQCYRVADNWTAWGPEGVRALTMLIAKMTLEAAAQECRNCRILEDIPAATVEVGAYDAACTYCAEQISKLGGEG